ncbi:hypothetical protein CJP72_15530 [Citrobacter sp. NCU1]|uniref:ParB/Srx family N-terminal domain-containing protein n=1 Tax=Citrobacter sp. NCU1 TaxID=2026683 RepID=UPI001391DBDB|nr:ParB/Srx family N-terminal domain-containing protein [Citrobacter sp. NCU1]NDO82124.1 hypothetical protein [Citrobacter sp. NCU1]
MTGYWWKDLFDRNNHWQGLTLTVRENSGAVQAVDILSGHHGRMALTLYGETLFWASMLKDHSGVWVILNSDYAGRRDVLPPVTSDDVEFIKGKPQGSWIGEWCRYFSRQLMNAPVPLLSPRRWLLRPMSAVKPSAPYSRQQPIPVENWRFESPESSGNFGCQWSLYGVDFPDLAHPDSVTLADWWWGGNLLLGRYSIQPDAGRLKWWRKKCREGTLPPILVWYIAGLGSFVILDGHYRLQAAIEEGIPPEFLVLSELNERELPSSPEERTRIVRALEKQQQNPGVNIEGINQTLINLYDNRYLYAATHSRAILGEGEAWAKELEDYLRRHHLDAYLAKIVDRVND